MNRKGSFDDKVALVTGAGSGIGRATALAFARAGARVVLAGRDETKLAGTLEIARSLGGEAVQVSCDITDSSSVGALMEAALDAYGTIDCAVNNAGCEGRIAPTVELTDADYAAAMDVNLKGLFHCLRAELRIMTSKGRGSIVNVSSIHGLQGAAGSGLYAAAKHATIGWTKTCALEVAAEGVRVNALCPGAVETGMLERVAGHFNPGAVEAGLESFAGMIPMKRLGRPEEMAESILWLSSDAASYVTGAVMVADGGLIAG